MNRDEIISYKAPIENDTPAAICRAALLAVMEAE